MPAVIGVRLSAGLGVGGGYLKLRFEGTMISGDHIQEGRGGGLSLLAVMLLELLGRKQRKAPCSPH